MQVNGVVPAAPAVDERPVLNLARLRYQLRDAVGVEGVRRATIDPNGPGERHALRAVRRALSGDRIARVAGPRATEFDRPSPDRGYDRDLFGQHRRHLTPVVGAATVW